MVVDTLFLILLLCHEWSCCRTGMAGVPGTASDIFETVKEVGANVVMISQVSALSSSEDRKSQMEDLLCDTCSCTRYQNILLFRGSTV